MPYEEEEYDEFDEEPVPQPRPKSSIRYEQPPEAQYHEYVDMALLAPSPELISSIGGSERGPGEDQRPRKRVDSTSLIDDSAFRKIMGGW